MWAALATYGHFWIIFVTFNHFWCLLTSFAHSSSTSQVHWTERHLTKSTLWTLSRIQSADPLPLIEKGRANYRFNANLKQNKKPIHPKILFQISKLMSIDKSNVSHSFILMAFSIRCFPEGNANMAHDVIGIKVKK